MNEDDIITEVVEHTPLSRLQEEAGERLRKADERRRAEALRLLDEYRDATVADIAEVSRIIQRTAKGRVQ